MAARAELDVVVYGATGYTGRLVAEYFAEKYGDGHGLAWAMAGRNLDKLAEVRRAIGATDEVRLIGVDADNAASLEALARQTRAVICTVGPYQYHGAGVVAACAAQGTDYLDLCGEPPFIRRMIDAHAGTAEQSGARILFSCGFDSLPFEAGVWFLQQAALAQIGSPLRDVKCRVRRMDGGFSGGTIASIKAIGDAMADEQTALLMQDPFALVPGFKGPAQPLGSEPAWDMDVQAWVAPFFMAGINTKNVHRSNALLRHAYGAEFRYEEMLVAGPGDAGAQVAQAIAATMGGMPQADLRPGEGPTPEEREAGSFDLLFVGKTVDGRSLRAAVTGDRDPGYGATSRMLAEAALCLRESPDVSGGVWTPVAALGARLLDRLSNNAGLVFHLEDH